MPHPQLPFRTARLIFLFSLIFFSAFTVSAQDITNLKFSDPKEKAAFGSSTLADSLLTTLCYSSAGASATDVENFKSKLNGVIENIAKSKGFQKDNAQRIKLVYKTIHDELFVQYELEHPFINLVLSGKYNCVSGTAIYAYVLERLNIPYQIKLLPQHVYLMAYPDTQPIRMEATQPEEGTTVFNDSFKKNYVNYLVSYKLVAKSELDHKSIDQIFTENFEKDESISFKELVGVQYWNQALYALEKENMEESHVNIQKAVQLYPCAKTKVLDTGIAAKLISAHRYKDPKADLGLLLSILKNDSSELIRNAMLDEFRQFSTIMINDRSDLTNYTSSSQWFIEQLTDSALKGNCLVYGKFSFNTLSNNRFNLSTRFR